MDWTKIRNDYINGHITYAKLAEKYEVSYHTLKEIAVNEKWFDKRKEQREKIRKKAEEKTVEKLAEREANRLLRISNAADRLLEKIEQATEQLDQFIVTNKVKQREVKYVNQKAGFGKPQKEITKEVEDKRIVKADHLDRLGLKQLASALKDLRDIQFTQNEEAEQESPNINIVVRAATLEDVEDDTDGEEE